MSKHHHPHPLGRKHNHHSHNHDHGDEPTFSWLLNIIKKVFQMRPDERGIIKGDFTCPEATYFNQKINEYRKESGAIPVDEHEHHPKFTRQERAYAIKEIMKKMQQNKDAYPLAIVSQKPNEIIYGNARDPKEQLKYTFSDDKWIITPGENVAAIIIDPAGKVIEIRPGPHIHQYGDGGNLMVEGACKDPHEERGHSHDHKKQHKRDEHEHPLHDGPCSHACGHGAKSQEHSHRNHSRIHG